jgi:hypothetical protein
VGKKVNFLNQKVVQRSHRGSDIFANRMNRTGTSNNCDCMQGTHVVTECLTSMTCGLGEMIVGGMSELSIWAEVPCNSQRFHRPGGNECGHSRNLKKCQKATSEIFFIYFYFSSSPIIIRTRRGIE